MIIDNLPVLPSKPATGDELAIERGQSTYKVGYDIMVGDSLSAIESGIAIIVSGDRAAMAVPVGGYAYIKGNTHGLTEGLYTNTSSAAFPASGGTADGTVFTAASGGGLNALNASLSNMTLLGTDSVSNFDYSKWKFIIVCPFNNINALYIPQMIPSYLLHLYEGKNIIWYGSGSEYYMINYSGGTISTSKNGIIGNIYIYGV